MATNQTSSSNPQAEKWATCWTPGEDPQYLKIEERTQEGPEQVVNCSNDLE